MNRSYESLRLAATPASRWLVAALLAALELGGPAAAGGAAAGPASAPRDGRIHLAVGPIDPARVPSFRPSPGPHAKGSRYWIVQLRPPLDRRRRAAIADLGATVLGAIPERAYIVRADATVARHLADEPAVAWIGPYRPAYRVSPTIGGVEPADPEHRFVREERLLVVSLFPGEDPDALLPAAVTAGARPHAILREAGAPRWIVRVDAGGEREIASIEGVEWVEELGEFPLVTSEGGTSDLFSHLRYASQDGARVHTSSWGHGARTEYTWRSVDVDRFSYEHEDHLVLLAASGATPSAPENAKNCLAVSTFLSGPGITSDGRRKPELCLPEGGFTAPRAEECGAEPRFGASAAVPAVAAAIAIARQHYLEGYHPTGTEVAKDGFAPSGALLKATLINGTSDASGTHAHLSSAEGWEEALLDDSLYLAGDVRGVVLRDVRNDVGLSTGEIDEIRISVRSGSPLAVTLVFTDAPPARGAAFAAVNDLDLVLVGPDAKFLGNVFASGKSTTGGAPDRRNNVERVVCPAESFPAGEWTIRVIGTDVPVGPQGYALHVRGEVSEAEVVGAAVREGPSEGSTRLAQNRPNPFARGTDISFAIARRCHVSLDVFDISGRHVRALSRGVLGEGAYTVPWDGRDATGEDVAGGIYFYRLEAGRIDETRKMVVLR